MRQRDRSTTGFTVLEMPLVVAILGVIVDGTLPRSCVTAVGRNVTNLIDLPPPTTKNVTRFLWKLPKDVGGSLSLFNLSTAGFTQ